MNDVNDPLEQLARLRDAGRRAALATVVATWGSSPRPVGSRLTVDDAGAFVGSVSGGCVEGAVVREAGELLREGGAPRLLEFGVSHEDAWAVGLACGGRISVLVEAVAPPLGAAVDAALTARSARRSFALATSLTGGTVACVALDGSVGADGPVAAAAREALGRGAAETRDLAGETWLLAPELAPARVLVVGAVHIAQALVPMARLVDLDVVVVDPRAAFATSARFPGADVRVAWPEEVIAEIGVDARTAVVALSHDEKVDGPALVAALRSDAFYVGALGSRKNQAARRARLLAAGFAEADVARIHGPIGLPIGARSPAEIALAITAEIVAALRRPGEARA
ncbi:MAG: XdhC family protein [Deltaproteobacteria bacterium]|nr:XdhC family protein [Deltaproteobacteria bacterium]